MFPPLAKLYVLSVFPFPQDLPSPFAPEFMTLGGGSVRKKILN